MPDWVVDDGVWGDEEEFEDLFAHLVWEFAEEESVGLNIKLLNELDALRMRGRRSTSVACNMLEEARRGWNLHTVGD